MGHGKDEMKWIILADELARSGRYQNIAEVEAALKAREPLAKLPQNGLMRGMLDGTCLRVRRAKGWTT